MTEERNASIIKKIKGLIAIANDEKNDEESQSAFIMAQKLMMKHNIAQSDVMDAQQSKEVSNGAVTVYKQLKWWETTLATIISENFRVKWYYANKTLEGERRVKRRITFLGFESDIELAKEMYILAYDVLVHYAKDFVDDYYKDSTWLKRDKATTVALKDSYMKGFLHAMNEKFEEQVAQMQQEYGLMVLVPAEVKEAYDVMFPPKSKGLYYRPPNVQNSNAYHQGYKHGKKVDYTKSTLDGNL